MKKPRYSSIFNPELLSFTCVKKRVIFYAHYTLCNRDVSVAYGGMESSKDKIRENMNKLLYIKLYKISLKNGMTSLTSYFSSRGPL